MILQGLVRHYERLKRAGAVDRPGFSEMKISFALLLAPDGTVLDVNDLRDHTGKKPRPRLLSVPYVRRTSGIAANFLWDKTAYALGAASKSKRLGEEHAAFRALHEQALKNTNDPGLKVFLAFLERWKPADFGGLSHADEMLDQNVVFRFGTDLGFLHERPTALDAWNRLRARETKDAVTCLVTGERGPLARLHHPIRGVPGAQTSGASLVSYNLDAFESYGKCQGENAPVSEGAVHAYCTALNDLIGARAGTDTEGRPRWRNRVQIGDATTVFWAEAADDPEGVTRAEHAEDLFASVVDPPTDEAEAERVGNVLRQAARGLPLADVDAKLDKQTRFHILGLSPNAARLSARYYYQDEFDKILKRAAHHFEDLRIEPHFWRAPPSLWRLLRETAARGEARNVSPALAREFMRSILTGGRYPRSLLALLLMRLRAGDAVNDLRAALLKACLVRDHRMGFEEEDVPVALDINETNIGYRLGRLFAILENAQRAALNNPIATIRDKYYSAASASPARVFPLLIRGAQDHIAAVRKRESPALAGWFDVGIAEVMAGLPAARPFPAMLRLKDQGRFAVGYYHQRNARAGRDSAPADRTEN